MSGWANVYRPLKDCFPASRYHFGKAFQGFTRSGKETIVRFHDEHRALATVGLVPVENPLEFGIVITRDDGSIERFLEKPSWGQVFSDTINSGIFVL